ncbi:MAG: Hsp70 family protein [Planctomycetota bacterium]|nr:Hsp70 family protein [Planctomycetota bacterium]
MSIKSDPIFVKTIARGKEGQRKLIYLKNTKDESISLTIKDVEKPTWLELSGIYQGVVLDFTPGEKKKVIVTVNGKHPLFPRQSPLQSVVTIFCENDIKVEIPLIIEKIEEEVKPFLGVFALDFGTTNSCYSYKHKLPTASEKEAYKRAVASDEMPSVIFFTDVSNRMNPEFFVGVRGKYQIKEQSSKVYSYFLSLKRLLGEDISFIVVDEHGAQQRWHIEEIASFIIKEFIRKAEEELGQKIFRVVATYPTLFSIDRKEAIKRSIQNALRMLGVKVDEKSVVMDLDETSSAAFNYIYNNMLMDFGKVMGLKERSEQLLVFDFGGGTIDICLVDAKITRNGKIKIETQLKGLSGEAYYAGDNVTLEIFKILKKRLALKIAQEHKNLLSKPEEEEKEEEDDIFSVIGTKKKKGEKESGIGDIFKEMLTEKEEKAEEKKVVLTGEGLEDVLNKTEEETWKSAVKTLLDYSSVVEKTIATTKSFLDLVIEKEKADGAFVGQDQSKRIAEQIEKAIETLVPTKWAVYESEDPEMELTARMLFYDIWHEAENLKIRLSTSGREAVNLQGELKKVAKYTEKFGLVDPVKFTEITVRVDEMERHIEEPIVKALKKAYALYKNQREKVTADKGVIVVGEEKGEKKLLKVILCGNSSNLPIVQRKAREVFKELPPENFIINKAELKKGTALGACEEYMLRSAFGEEGAISYSSKGFLERIPYSIGLLDKNLELLDPRRFPRGFYTIFERGTAVKSQNIVSEKDVFLIKPDMSDTVLPVYADYHDGDEPHFVGYLDFSQPVDKLPNYQPDEESKKMTRIRFEILETREVQAVNLKTGEIFAFIPNKETWGKEFPFSGYH